MVMRKMPKKLKDLVSFTLSIQISDSYVVHYFNDLGIGINFMTLSMLKTLGLEKLRQLSMVLQMADQTKFHPKGIIEDVLIKVGKLIIPTDFIVLYCDVDDRAPIILGYLFLTIGEVLIDVREGILKVRVDNEEVVFKMYKPLNKPFHYKDLCMITVM